MTEPENTNRVAHVHHYVLTGGPAFWAECDVVVDLASGICRSKLAGDNGPIVGSRARVEAAIRAT